MSDQKKDNWSSEEYQHSAAFVPQLATKVVQWLDVRKDDRILDVGCGDGVLDVEIGKILARGDGVLYGTDSSAAMIEAAQKASSAAGVDSKCTFEVVDAHDLSSKPIGDTYYTKVFSNAALHWILKPGAPSTRFFTAMRDALVPGGALVFEMGGLGNVSEMRTALVAATARQLGSIEKAKAVDPWFFPDEAWIRRTLETEVGGWAVGRVEREWRPTKAGKGGVEGWVRLMGKEFLAVIERQKGKEAAEEAVREASEALRFVCDDGNGGEMISYVRLRCLARKL